MSCFYCGNPFHISMFGISFIKQNLSKIFRTVSVADGGRISGLIGYLAEQTRFQSSIKLCIIISREDTNHGRWL